MVHTLQQLLPSLTVLIGTIVLFLLFVQTRGLALKYLVSGLFVINDTGATIATVEAIQDIYNYHVAIALKDFLFELIEKLFRAYDSIRSGQARQILARYPVDALVQVYYDPQNPQNCTLEPGLQAAPFSSLVILPIALLMSTCLWLLVGFHILSTLFQK